MTAFATLLDRLGARFGLTVTREEDDVVGLVSDDGVSLLLAAYDDRWVVLYHELDEVAGGRRPDNVFGEHWPAHVVGNIDGVAVLWSQRPLEGLDELELERWVSAFVASAQGWRAEAAPAVPLGVKGWLPR